MDDNRQQDLCYYGIYRGEGYIVVARTETGYMQERETEYTEDQVLEWRRSGLRELQPIDPTVRFNWGYRGSGPSQTSRAILGDALGEEASPAMAMAFTSDFVSQFRREFRIRQGAVLRWARGVRCDMGVHDSPSPLPPVDLNDKAYRWQKVRRLP